MSGKIFTKQDGLSAMMASEVENSEVSSIHVLDRVSAILAETGLELDDVMQSLARLLAEILGDVCFIRLLEADGQTLRPSGYYAVDAEIGASVQELFKSAALPVGDGVTGRAFRERKIVRFEFQSVSEAQETCTSRYHDIIAKYGVSCLLAAPLLYRGEPIGSLVIARRERREIYSAEDEILLRGIADRASITIANAKLYQESKRAQIEAAQLANRVRMVGDAVPALISYIDSTLTYRFVNASYERVFFITREQIIGRHMSEVMKPESFAILCPKVTQALSGSTVRFESEFTLKTGERRVFEIIYVPDRQGGEIKGVCTLANDVTERKNAEVALKQSLKEISAARAEAEIARQHAEAGNRAKDVFLATLSHELRTPLTTILSYSQMLRMGILSPENTKKGMEMIEQSALTQAQLINDLLDISRITMGKLVLTLRDVDPAEILRTTIESLRPQIEQKSLRVVTHFSTPVASMSADPVRLKQIFLNLLTNAVKFSNIGGKIEVRLDPIDVQGVEHLQLRVIDSGKGISRDFLPYVFDRFKQADSSTTRLHGGMGLGLAIVRALAEQHGGTVSAESEGVGKGATLTVRIPLRPAQDSGAPSFSPASCHPSSEEKAFRDVTSAVRLDGLKIVLVDDDKSARESLALLLATLGAEVRTAASACEGYQLVIGSKPDILVSDISMPGEDGFSLMGKVRALGLNEGGLVPSIALTAFAGVEDMQRAFAAGFQAHLAKPVNAVRLARTIIELLHPMR